MFTIFFLIKLGVAFVLVIGLSLLAERVSPKVAGILSAYPTITALSLFFFGLEISPKFATTSALYNLLGLIATLSFVYFYYRASVYFQKFNILLSSLSALLGYTIVAWILHFIEPKPFFIVSLVTGFNLLFWYLLREIKNVKIINKIKLNHRVLFFRGMFTIFAILLITGVPKMIGPVWAGMFSSFPNSIFPLILIIHFTYTKEHAHAFIKSVPIGIFAVILYSLTVAVSYPLYGVYHGTLLAFTLATGYLIIFSFVKVKFFKKENV